eukprot:TRINITY_DN6451_c0_g2_i1.p1 TRINITY_DN6451_c0_g2~~TRINITY_DN6451_c0_g2_i1.p1  ORF type:complete len:1353 (-),score=186.66 TRINITY_DN6451_c0_g2_i1:110-4024(-)
MGQAPEPMRSAAVAEFLEMSSTCAILASSHSDENFPGTFLAIALGAVSATCLPIEDSSKKADCLVLRQRYENAESRACSIVSGVISRTLLIADKDSEAWAKLEAFARGLLKFSGNPQWSSAPLMLLCLVRGLVRVATASRNTDMTWTQREFAAKLVGIISAALCRDQALVGSWQEDCPTDARCQECSIGRVAKDRGASKADKLCDLCSLRAWAATTQSRKLYYSAEGPWGPLLTLLDALPRRSPLPPLVPPASEAHPNKQSLVGAVISADDVTLNSCFLLCALGAGNGATSRNTSQKRAKQRSKASTTDDTKSSEPVGIRDADESCLPWTCALWANRADVRELSKLGSGSLRSCNVVIPCAGRLYRSALHRDASSSLSIGRRVAMEALLTLSKGSPLAHVRRQAIVGLNASCRADAQLVASRCVAEVVALSLHDDSVLVRIAGMDLISKLDSSPTLGDALALRIAELRTAAGARVADASPIVRRSACLIACASLSKCAENESLFAGISDLLWRTRDDVAVVRSPVLGAIERIILDSRSPQDALNTLLALLAIPRCGGTGIRDVLKARKSKLDSTDYVASVSALSACAFDRLRKDEEDPTRLSTILEHLSAECPEALHPYLSQVRSWLSSESGPRASGEGIGLALSACRVLANSLPSWAKTADSSQRELLGRRVAKALQPWMDSDDMGLLRAAVECVCIVGAQFTGDFDHALRCFQQSMDYLRRVVDSRSPLDAQAQKSVCREALLVGSMLEFMDVDGVVAAILDGGHVATQSAAKDAIRLFGVLSTCGPQSMRPSIVPCLGYLLRQYPALLQDAQGTQISPLQVFQSGLQGGDQASALQLHTVQTLSSLLGSYQTTVESLATLQVKPAEGSSLISEAAQQLAKLQGQLLRLLLETSAEVIASSVLKVLTSMHDLGVLHPSSAFPCLLTASLGGFQQISKVAQRLMLRLLETTPSLLEKRLGAGIRQASSVLLARKVLPGDVGCDGWRFMGLREAYSEILDTRVVRERLIDALLTEISGVTSEQEGLHLQLLRLELLFGVLARLTLRTEGEVARVAHGAAQFVGLRAAPLLPDFDASAEEADAEVKPGEWELSFSIAAASVLYNCLCQHLSGGTPDELTRFIALGSDAGVLRGAAGSAAGEPLPLGLARRPPVDLKPLLRELWQVATTAKRDGGEGSAALRGLLARHLDEDSRLLRGAAGAAALARAQRGRACRSGRRRCSSVADAAGSGGGDAAKAAAKAKAKARAKTKAAAGAAGVSAAAVGSKRTDACAAGQEPQATKRRRSAPGSSSATAAVAPAAPASAA